MVHSEGVAVYDLNIPRGYVQDIGYALALAQNSVSSDKIWVRSVDTHEVCDENIESMLTRGPDVRVGDISVRLSLAGSGFSSGERFYDAASLFAELFVQQIQAYARDESKAQEVAKRVAYQ